MSGEQKPEKFVDYNGLYQRYKFDVTRHNDAQTDKSKKIPLVSFEEFCAAYDAAPDSIKIMVQYLAMPELYREEKTVTCVYEPIEVPADTTAVGLKSIMNALGQNGWEFLGSIQLPASSRETPKTFAVFGIKTEHVEIENAEDLATQASPPYCPPANDAEQWLRDNRGKKPEDIHGLT